MQIIKCDQRSEDWYKCRLGIPSSSCFDRIITNDGTPSKQAKDYMLELAMEQFTSQTEESYQSKAMADGVVREDIARAEYELINGCIVEQVGFCLHDSGIFGCSPDGLRQSIQKGLEIKSPKAKTYAKYKLNPDQAVSDYKQQLQGSMLVTDYKVWDFCIYYPGADLIEIEVVRDDEYCNILYREIFKFNKALKELVNKLRK